jgi:hypothetical protein
MSLVAILLLVIIFLMLGGAALVGCFFRIILWIFLVFAAVMALAVLF